MLHRLGTAPISRAGRTQLLTKPVLATQFTPQRSQAEQSAAEQRNCRAAIGNARRSNADVVQKEEASSVKLYRRRGAQSGESKRELGVAR